MDLGRVATGADALDEMIEGGFPKGSLIIVAGNPGAGKTAFATNFVCKGIHLKETAVYASLGEPKEAFIVEASKHFRLDVEGFLRSEQMNFLDLSAVREGGAPTVIQSILDRVERMKARRLVIDSFSAMALAFEKKLDTRNILQAILTKVVRQLGCTTILVVEVPFGDEHVGTGVEEFVADGVIKLSSEILEDRLIRVLEIVKLRGTRIPERKLVFTLEGGFRVFPPFKTKVAEKPQKFKAIADQPRMFSTGSEELDRLIGGGYPIGSTVLFEVEKGVPDFHAQLILGQTARNFLAKGRAGIMIPSTGIDAEMMKASAQRLGFIDDDIDRLLRICLIRTSAAGEKPYVVPLKAESLDSDNKQIRELEEDLMKKTGQPVVYIMGYDSGIANYGVEAIMRAAVFDAARAKEKGNLAIIVLKPGYGAASMVISELADLHLKLTEKHCALILYGIKPRTNLHVVEIDTSKGYPQPKLTPIV